MRGRRGGGAEEGERKRRGWLEGKSKRRAPIMNERDEGGRVRKEEWRRVSEQQKEGNTQKEGGAQREGH